MNSKRLDLGSRSLRLLFVLSCAWILIALPAQAGNEFGDAFERQLGKLAAVEVFHIGHGVLYDLHAPYHPHRAVGHHSVSRPHGHRGLHLGHSKHHRKDHYGHDARYERDRGYGSRHSAYQDHRCDGHDRYDSHHH